MLNCSFQLNYSWLTCVKLVSIKHGVDNEQEELMDYEKIMTVICKLCREGY